MTAEILKQGAALPALDGERAAADARAWRRREVALRWGVRASLTSWTETLRHVRRPGDVGLRLAREVLGEVGRPMVAADRERLSAQEHADLDLMMLDRVREVLAGPRPQGGLLIAPASFFALGTGSSRSRLIAALTELRTDERGALIFEVEDVALGTPVDRIKEVLDALRPYCRGLVVRCAATRAAVEALRGCALRGISLDMEGVNGRAGEAFGRVKLMADRSKGIASDVMALGLPASIPPEITVAGGASFHSVRPAGPERAGTT